MSQSNREFLALHHRLEKILQEFIRELQKVEDHPSTYNPAVDILVTDESVTAILDAPGVRKEDIMISFAAGLLTIQGEKHWPRCESRQHLLIERNFGSFYKVISLRDPVNVADAKAVLANGILKIEFPRVRERRQQVYQIPLEEE